MRAPERGSGCCDCRRACPTFTHMEEAARYQKKKKNRSLLRGPSGHQMSPHKRCAPSQALTKETKPTAFIPSPFPGAAPGSKAARCLHDRSAPRGRSLRAALANIDLVPGPAAPATRPHAPPGAGHKGGRQPGAEERRAGQERPARPHVSAAAAAAEPPPARRRRLVVPHGVLTHLEVPRRDAVTSRPRTRRRRPPRPRSRNTHFPHLSATGRARRRRAATPRRRRGTLLRRQTSFLFF